MYLSTGVLLRLWRRSCIEEGTHSAWLYEILSPHVEEIVAASISESRGRKSVSEKGSIT